MQEISVQELITLLSAEDPQSFVAIEQGINCGDLEAGLVVSFPNDPKSLKAYIGIKPVDNEYGYGGTTEKTPDLRIVISNDK